MTVDKTSADLLARVLAPGFLQGQLGFSASARALRLKPGTSLLLAWQDAAGRQGWLRLLWPQGSAKARKHQQAAERAGYRAPVTELRLGGQDFLCQSGPLAADPKLLAPLAESGLLQAPEVKVLRYNPARRLVASYRGADGGRRVVRVLADGQRAENSLYSLLVPYLPLPGVLAGDSFCPLPALAFVGSRDLSSGQSLEEARQAGALFARLHRVPLAELTASDAGSSSQLKRLAASLAWEQNPARQQLQVHARLLEALDPQLAQRCQGLADSIPGLEGPAVLLHGDASPDQVLTGGSPGEKSYWLTDFDRASLGPSALDLGSYLATSSEQAGRAFLTGYQETGGLLPTDRELEIGRAQAQALKLMTPLRQARPDWRQQVAAGLDEIEERL